MKKEAEENARRLLAEEAARRAAEQYLHLVEHQREQLRVTLTSIGDGVITTDAAGRVTLINRVTEGLTGWTNAEAIGQPLEKVFPIVNELTRQPVENPVAKVLATGTVQGLANRTLLIARDGTEVPIDDSAAPIHDGSGRIAGCVLIFRDVSERRRFERESAERLATARLLAAIVESSDDAIVSKTLDGVIRSWNAAAERMFGYSAAQAIGRHISLIIPRERLAEEDEILARLRAGQQVDHFETERIGRDGRRVQISLTISPIKDDNGQVIGASKIARDISERKRAEAELREADRRKDQFLAMLAHELRNPLAPIRNAAQILKVKGLPDPDLAWSREVIERQLQHMTRLLDDLLDVSRVSRDRLELRRERVDLAQVLQSALETSRPLIDAEGHELSVRLPDEPVYLDGDPVRLAQVFSNLLNNAARYMDARGRIRVVAERTGAHVSVSVQDAGLGIAPEVLPHIFEMFHQGQTAGASAKGGMGIGLSLARRLVELHGGSLEGRSAGPGQGSEFIVRLPVADAAPVTADADAAAEERTPVPRRVLVVDDLQDSADSLVFLLSAMGHEAHAAYDGESALALAAQVRPDLVLLDIGMPEMSGYDVCRRIREQPWGGTMFLVALTGWGQEDDRRRSVEAGFDEHLVKPVEPEALESLLAALPPRAD
ncbi:MAG TPA: PAS domain S-box protein [Burkholderiaceae bacterium]|nr:PAS domain S-box protein [Burkholderiaceae bacterium]